MLPSVLILGSLFLGHRYRLLHLAGVVFSLIGYGCIVSSDFAGSEDARKPLAPLSGDLLCAAAAALFACSSLGQEFLLRSCAPATILRRMQPAAAVLSGCQLLLFHASELSELRRLLADPLGPRGGPFLGTALALVCMYALAPQVIAKGGAALFNVSLLTANIYGSIWALAYNGEELSTMKALGSLSVL
ncbi:unnamed protein product, partial [Polarella glacialis]